MAGEGGKEGEEEGDQTIMALLRELKSRRWLSLENFMHNTMLVWAVRKRVRHRGS